MTQNGVSAPTTGQNGTFPRASQDLVHISGTATVINVPSTAPTHVDARIRDRYVQYTSDPRADAGTPGLWRTAGDGIRELISPFALVEIAAGRHGCEIRAVRPGTENTWAFEGSLDDVATSLWRAGQRFGCRAERKTLYWALFEFCGLARRQRAARGAVQ